MLVSSLRLLKTLFWRVIVSDETGIQGGTLRILLDAYGIFLNFLNNASNIIKLLFMALPFSIFIVS
jgi:hypothetical protein